jgi:hypothetical protein
LVAMAGIFFSGDRGGMVVIVWIVPWRMISRRRSHQYLMWRVKFG